MTFVRSLESRPAQPLSPPQPMRWLDRLARRLVVGRLSGLRDGQITLDDATGRTRLGAGGDLHATVRVHDSGFYRQAALGSNLAVALSFVRGEWECDDLPALIRMFVRNEAAAERLESRWARLTHGLHRLAHRWHANTLRGSRRNIQAHYDLGNDFFELWLDDTWAYSSGIFAAPGATLRDASVEKFDRICRKLDLRPGDHLLEIGTGWGGLAIHAAEHYDCRVTTTTISQQQYELADRRIKAAGLSDRVQLLFKDYRELTGRFDKLVSIEMIEAVGHKYLDTYFRKCGELLKPEGSLLLQAIVMPERGYDAYLNSVDFIRRYVFPGGCLPSITSTLESIGRTSRLRLVHAEDFGSHYAETLRRWRASFQQRLPQVRQLGYSEELIRLWDYYLCYCEGAFEERHVGVVQLCFDNHECRRDPIKIGQRAAQVPSLERERSAPVKNSHFHSCLSESPR